MIASIRRSVICSHYYHMDEILLIPKMVSIVLVKQLKSINLGLCSVPWAV